MTGWTKEHDTPDTQRAKIRGSMRGKSILKNFRVEKLLEETTTSFGGMRFVSMDPGSIAGAQLLLDTCAETLQTSRSKPEVDSRSFSSRRYRRCASNRMTGFTRVRDFSKRMVRHLSSRNLVAPPSVYSFNLSHNTVLQTLEVRASDSFWEPFRNLEALLPSIASPVFSRSSSCSPKKRCVGRHKAWPGHFMRYTKSGRFACRPVWRQCRKSETRISGP